MDLFDGFDFSKIQLPEMSIPPIKIPEMPIIDPEDTIMGQIKREVKEQNKLALQQITVLSEQNKLLADNYNKLKEMYDKQLESYRETKEDLKKSRSFNRWMMIIAIVAMLAAIAGPVVTVLVAK